MRDAEGRARGFRKRTQGVRVKDESGPAERQRPEAAAWNSGGRKCGVGGTAVWFAPIRSATSPRHPSRKAPRASETESGEGPQVAWVGPRGGSVAGRRPEWGPRPGPRGVKEKGAAGDPRRPPVSCCRAEAGETGPALTTVPATWRSWDPDRAVREPGRRMRQAGGAQGRKRVWGSATTGAGRRCRGGLRKAASPLGVSGDRHRRDPLDAAEPAEGKPGPGAGALTHTGPDRTPHAARCQGCRWRW